MYKNQKIVFMGTPAFASVVLESLIENGYNISLIVTQPDKLVGRKKQLEASPVKKLAIKHNIKVFQPLKIKEDYQSIIDEKPDLVITCAYGQIIPKAILDYPKYRCINVHGSLLPRHRGGAPIQRSIINGDDETGISIMFMEEKMDSGDILYQEKLAIDINDTATTLFEKLALLASKMLINFLPKYFNNDFEAIKQDESKVTYSYNLKKEEEYIKFNRNVLSVHNHIRGMNDNPGCFFMVNDKKYKIIKAHFIKDETSKAGFIYGLDGSSLKIGAISGYILIDEIKPEGKNSMDGKAFFNGVGKNLVGKKID